jgi:glucans biosynthesis protein C
LTLIPEADHVDRRHELDWLRVLLFALLVPHHVAVGFVDWGVDIYRFVNNELAGDGMTLFIYWSHSWRLPSLFLISGIGTWFLTGRGTGPRFIGARLLRLLVPAVFGAALLNVFGGYAIALMTNEPPGFLTFWWLWLTEPRPRQVQHLWLLINLAIYSLLCWPIFALHDRLARMPLSPRLLLVTLVTASALSAIVFKPHAPALAGDNYQFALYLIFFLGGYLIGAKHEIALDWAGRHAFTLLTAAVLLFFAKATLLALALLDDVPTGQALAAGGWVPAGLEPAHASIFSVVEAATAWAWCLAALGLAVRFLNMPSRILTELNRSVFPVYVLHFPVTLVGLAIAAQLSWSWPVEFILLLIFVYGVTWMLWRLADRLGAAAFLVGGNPARRAGVTAAAGSG